MRFEVTILGCNSATPAYNRYPSAQVLNVQEHLYLIDCGEGTQMQMGRFGIRRGRINQIFISHLHGDHIFGLIGLLTSYSLGGRSEAMDIFSPAGLEEIIRIQLDHTGGELSYPLCFHVVNPTQYKRIYHDDVVEVYSLPLVHRIPTTGYLFREKAFPPNIRKDMIETLAIPFSRIPAIKQGGDFVRPDGTVVPNAALTIPPAAPRSYAYCSDTMYHEALVPQIRGVDMLYHETTFCSDFAEHAAISMHSTAAQAATIAKMAGVKQLITGHYSTRYKDLSAFLEEAATVFEPTVLGQEGKTYSVAYRAHVPE